MSDTEHQVNIHAIEEEVMAEVNKTEDQEARNTRDKIAAYDEQIMGLDTSIAELAAKIDEAVAALETRRDHRAYLTQRREIEHDKLAALLRLERMG